MYFYLMDLNFGLEDIREVARLFWRDSGKSAIFAFHGEMGSGKTTFIKNLLTLRGVPDLVTSPTFSIINEYQGVNEQGIPGIFYHIDLFRLKDTEEAIRAGVEDCLQGEALCFIEWPELIDSILPADTLHVYLSVLGDRERRLLTR